MKKAKKKTTSKRASNSDQMDMFSISRHTSGHVHEPLDTTSLNIGSPLFLNYNLPEGWKIVAATDPSKDPKQAEIDELRRVQKLFYPYLIKFKMDFPNAQLHIYAAWEAAFVAGYFIGKRENYASELAHMVFQKWADGSEHRLVILADKAFKLGLNASKVRTVENLIVQSQAAETIVNKRHLTQKDFPFVIQVKSPNTMTTLYFKEWPINGTPQLTLHFKHAAQFRLMTKAVKLSQKIDEFLIHRVPKTRKTTRIVRYQDEVRRLSNR